MKEWRERAEADGRLRPWREAMDLASGRTGAPVLKPVFQEPPAPGASHRSDRDDWMQVGQARIGEDGRWRIIEVCRS